MKQNHHTFESAWMRSPPLARLRTPYRSYSCGRLILLLASMCLTGLAFAPAASSHQTISVLYNFDGTTGSYAVSGLIQGTDGALYGTAYFGGSSGYGTVFRLYRDGTGFTVLHNFDETTGQSFGGVTQGTDGGLYGATIFYGNAGPGTVFKLNADGSDFTVLCNFGGTTGSAARLLQGTDGVFYGTTYNGGSSDYGTVFGLNPDGSGFTVHYHFNGPTTGANPYCGVMQGTDGALYGTAYLGGSSGFGTLFKLKPDGTGFTVLHNFDGTTGAYPMDVVIQGTDGALYGTARFGGNSGFGTVFKLNPDGTGFTVLHNFDGTTGAEALVGVIQGTDGALYGGTYSGGSSGYGTLFRLNPNGTGFTVLHNFDGTTGANPHRRLMQGVDGSLYGTTTSGGSSGYGTVFRLDLANTPPVAVDDTAETAKNTPIIVQVLNNDTDSDGDILTVASATQGSLGTVTINTNGTLTYTPTTGVFGADNFTYTLSDGYGGIATASVTITITKNSPANIAPNALNDSVSTLNHKEVTVNVLVNDTDPDGNYPLTVISITQPSNGTAVLNADETVTYTPTGAFSGNDKFTYAIADSMGGMATAVVTVQVAPNINPTAGNDYTSTLSTPVTPRNIDLLANDSDPDGDAIRLVSFTQPTSGTVTFNSDGKAVTYTPVQGFKGKVTFTYTIADAFGGTDTGTVSITVSTSGASVAVNDVVTTAINTPVTLNVLANDSDPDGDPLTVSSVTQPDAGTLVNNGDGTVTYTPRPEYRGKARFSYTITDGMNTATGNVTVTVLR